MAEITSISPQTLRRLSSGRWFIPILATMNGENGSRFSTLARRLGGSRSVLSRHLDAIESFGWIARNPGHGHPLRPEYLLTTVGRPIAAWCERVMAQRMRLDLKRHDLSRWSLPVLFELAERHRRFSELERSLAPITPRALSLTLKQMLDVRLISRSFGDALPLYGLTSRGEQFAAPLLSAC